MDKYLHRAETLYNQDDKQDDFNRADENEDWFPHKELPIFERNETICQEMNARERKRNIEKERDRHTWSQWDQQRAGLVQRYNEATTQRFSNAAKYETSFISLQQKLIKRSNHGIALSTGTCQLYCKGIWVADTGASCHTTNSDQGSVLTKNARARMKSMKPSLDASGNEMKTRKLIDITNLIFNSRTKKNIIITMMNCRFGGSKFNLCSLIKMTDSGWKMSGDKTGIYLSKRGTVIHFNIPISTPEGRIWAIQMDRRPNKEAELSLASPSPMEMNTERAHYYCGHNSIRETKVTAKHLGWKLTSTPFDRCESCAIGKAKKSNLGDGGSNQPKCIGELWGIDGMKLKRPIRETVHFPGANCMNMAVDHTTGAAFLPNQPSLIHFASSFITGRLQPTRESSGSDATTQERTRASNQ